MEYIIGKRQRQNVIFQLAEKQDFITGIKIGQNCDTYWKALLKV